MSLFTGAAAAALGAGIMAGGTTAAAALQSHAAGSAADLQAKAAEDALAFTKQKQAEQQAAFTPYQNLGAQAVGNLPSMARPMPLQWPPAPYTTQPGATRPAMPTTLSGMGQPLLRSGPGPMVNTQPVGQPVTNSPQQPQMVTLQAPDGTQKSVPADQAAYYIAKGAKQV